MIDYIVKINGEISDDKFFGRHFQIKYNKKEHEYYLKDLGKGFGTFINIDKWVEIKNNSLINIGESYILITLGSTEDISISDDNDNDNGKDAENSINLKIFSENIRNGNLSFTMKQSPFIIGRLQDCDVIIDDNMLSRFHCYIELRNDKWFIIDGYFDKNNNHKKSTNGTWIYAYDDTIITNGMIFKSINNLFKCNYEF